MGVTVNEIARICGVSRTTVLRALNNQSRVSDKTRRQVLEVARELGYRPNLLARSLNTGRTMTLGIVAINMDSLIFVQTLSAINTEAQRKGYSLNIALHGQSSEAEMQRIRDFTDRRMEGILLSPISKGPEFERFVLSLGIPVVCIGNHVSEKISTVMIDEELATREAVRLIASKGYRRIVFVCPPLAYESQQNICSHIRRKRGLEAETALHPGLSCQIIASDDYVQQLSPVLGTLGDVRTAILCSGDIYALNIMRYFKAHKIKTPRDVGIMGFDNISILEYIVPRLTTVSTNVENVAVVAVNELISQIEGDRAVAKKIVLPHKILDMETL